MLLNELAELKVDRHWSSNNPKA